MYNERVVMKKKILNLILLICLCVPALIVSADEGITNLGWDPTGKYWYEDGIRKGTAEDPDCVKINGKAVGLEKYDYGTNSWYWLDATLDGEKAANKEVWIPYVYTFEKDITEKEIWSVAKRSPVMEKQVHDAMLAGTGKMVRYDENGRMVKGWYTVTGKEIALYPDQVNNTYYYDHTCGLMAKGDVVIDGQTYHFDEETGVMDKPVLKTTNYVFQIDSALPQEYIKIGNKCSFLINKISFDEADGLYCVLEYQPVIEGKWNNSKMYVEVSFIDDQKNVVYADKFKLKKKMESVKKKLNKSALPNGSYHVEIKVSDS